MIMKKDVILIDEAYWRNYHLSVAEIYGGIKINGKMYKLCKKDKEPIDLVIKDWIPIYKAIDRRKFIEVIESETSLKDAKELYCKGESSCSKI